MLLADISIKTHAHNPRNRHNTWCHPPSPVQRTPRDVSSRQHPGHHRCISEINEVSQWKSSQWWRHDDWGSRDYVHVGDLCWGIWVYFPDPKMGTGVPGSLPKGRYDNKEDDQSILIETLRIVNHQLSVLETTLFKIDLYTPCTTANFTWL